MTKRFNIKADGVRAYMDDNIGIGFITYGGTITAEATYRTFDWLANLFDQITPDELQGIIYDYRAVARFDRTYLSTVQRQYQKLVAKPIADHPVAIITGSMYQEKMIRMTQQLGPPQMAAHTRIVPSMQDALTYIDAWHNRNEAWI